ncbi:MAG: DUF1573 domain-containing protein [Candidatus Omnitrophica bacterium]|nr:DUF1573 domain-containing protein [Candidatus Omnitrophota bacterium]
MKKRLYLSLFLVLVITFVESTLIYAQPAAVLEEDTYDAGVVSPQEAVSYDYVIKNTGDQDLILKDVKTTCGCTAAILSATTIAPDATGVISVKMNTGSYDSKMSKAAILYTNDPKKEQVRMNIKAEVRNLLIFDPKPNFDFGKIPFNQDASMTLYLKSRDDEKFDVSECKSFHPSLSVSVGEREEKGIPITVKVQPEKIRDRFYNTLQIDTTHPTQKIFRCRVIANVIGPIEFTPSTLYFGSVTPNQKISREIKAQLSEFMPSQDQEWKITEIEFDEDEDITSEIKTDKDNKNGYVLNFTYTAPDKIGYRHGVAKIHTTLKESPIVQVNYSAVIRKEKTE